jgi:hypothetical protein
MFIGDWGHQKEVEGDRKGYRGVEIMEVCFICTYEDYIMKPIKHHLKKVGGSTRK